MRDTSSGTSGKGRTEGGRRTECALPETTRSRRHHQAVGRGAVDRAGGHRTAAPTHGCFASEGGSAGLPPHPRLAHRVIRPSPTSYGAMLDTPDRTPTCNRRPRAPDTPLRSPKRTWLPATPPIRRGTFPRLGQQAVNVRSSSPVHRRPASRPPGSGGTTPRRHVVVFPRWREPTSRRTPRRASAGGPNCSPRHSSCSNARATSTRGWPTSRRRPASPTAPSTRISSAHRTGRGHRPPARRRGARG